jgi:hypothetical protein
VGAVAEAQQLRDADLAALALHDAPARHRDLDALALDLDGAVALRARGEDAELHRRPRRALDAAGGNPAVHARDRAAVHAEDEVAPPDARPLGRRAVEHAQHLQAAPVLLDVHPDALELAAHGLAELASLLRRQVVRIGIAERVHDAPERGVVELLLVHPLVVVLLDRVDDLRAQRAVLLDEGVADRSRQGLGMAAEPDAGDQRHEGAQENDQTSRHGSRGG